MRTFQDEFKSGLDEARGQYSKAFDDPLRVQVGQDGNPLYNEDSYREVIKVLTIFDYDVRQYMDFFIRMNKVIDFRADRQWTDAELSYFKKQRREPLTINIMRPNISHVSGMQRSSRSEVTVKPVDMYGDPALAKLASDIINASDYASQIAVIDSLVFNDGLCGIGNYHIFKEIGSVYGNTLSERDDPFCTFYDSDYTDPLMRDCRRKTRLFYFRPEEIKNKFPQTKSLTFQNDEREEWWKDLQAVKDPIAAVRGQVVQRVNDLYAVIELTERKTKNVRVMIDAMTGQDYGEFQGPVEQARIIRAMNPTMAFRQMERKYMEVTTIMPYCYQLLDKHTEPYQYYDSVPFLSVRDGQCIPRCSSYNYGMIGMQREKNIRRSKYLEFIIRSVSGEYWVAKSGGSSTLLTQLNAGGHKAGISYEVEGQFPQNIMTPYMFQDLVLLETGAVQDFMNYTGLSVRPYGRGEFAGESGTHLELAKEQTNITIYPMLDEFDQSRVLRSHAILERRIDQLDLPQALAVSSRDNNKPQFIELTRELIAKLKQVYGKGISFSGIQVENGPFVTTQKRQEHEERLVLYEFLARNFGAEILNPADILRDSGLPDASDTAAAVEERWMAKIAPPAIINQGGQSPFGGPQGEQIGGQSSQGGPPEGVPINGTV